jgi:phage gpG-like protein
MLTVKVAVTPNIGNARAALNAIQSVFSTPWLPTIIGEQAVADSKASWAYQNDPLTGQRWPQRKGGGPVGGDRLRGTIRYELRGRKMVDVGTDAEHGRIFGKGGTIRPKIKQYLAVAVNSWIQQEWERGGRDYRSVYPDAFVIRAKNRRLYLVERQGRRGLRVLARLMKSKKIPKRNFLGIRPQGYYEIGRKVDARISGMWNALYGAGFVIARP